jgi:hypothetical protein
LCCEYVDLTQPQLSGNGEVDVDVEVETDRHSTLLAF